MERDKGEIILPQPSAETIRTPEGEGHSQVVMVTGVMGAGKDCLLDLAMAQAPDWGEVQFLNGGTILSLALGMDRDDLRKRPLVDGKKDIETILEYTLSHTPNVLNTHTVHKQADLFVYDPTFYRRINPIHFVQIHCDPTTIYQNRQKGDRKRDLEDIDTIEEHQSMVWSKLEYLTRKRKAGWSVIHNNNQSNYGQTLANAKFLADLINDTLR